MNWIDAIIIVILLIFIIVGVCKGFMFSILSVFSSFVNFCIALVLTKPCTTLLNQWFDLEGTLTNKLSIKLANMSEGFSTNLVGMSNSEISTHVSNTLKESKFPLESLFNNLLKIDSEVISSKESLTLGEILSKSLGSFFSFIITFVILFILIYLILFILSKFSSKAKEVEGIRVIDRILGVLFGFIKGSLLVVFIFAILSFFKEDGLLKSLFNYIEGSQLGTFIYNYINPFVDKYLNFETLKSIINK